MAEATIYFTESVFVDEGSPTNNQDFQDYDFCGMQTKDYQRNILLRLDYSGDIAAADTINSATFYFRVVQAIGNPLDYTYSVWRCPTETYPWVIDACTWNVDGAGNNWAGGARDVGAPYHEFTGPSGVEWVDVDITSLFQHIHADHYADCDLLMYGLQVIGEGESAEWTQARYSAEAVNPYVVVDYTPAGAAAYVPKVMQY